MLSLLSATDEALGRPDPIMVVDIGAGHGRLLQHLAELASPSLDRRLRLAAVELAPRPADLESRIGWGDQLPEPDSVTGLVIATEWLDNVALDVAESDSAGVLRYVLVQPTTGHEVLGDELDDADANWAARWWPQPRHPGTRVELGAPRDLAWSAAVAAVSRGLAVAVDYGHQRASRPGVGTLTGFRAGRPAAPVPDGSRDLTAHVAIDAVRAAGQAVAGQPAALVRQRDALMALGLAGRRPALAQAYHDPAGYLRALANATEAADLIDPTGLGSHYWLLQPVGIAPTTMPPELRPVTTGLGC